VDERFMDKLSFAGNVKGDRRERACSERASVGVKCRSNALPIR
jgi:hypothetical protein